jgi:hypothetical protein
MSEKKQRKFLSFVDCGGLWDFFEVFRVFSWSFFDNKTKI